MPRQRLPVASWLYEVTWAHTHVAPPVDDRRSWGKPEWPDQSPGSVPDLLTWVLDRKCEFIAIHEESKDDIMHHD